MILTKVPPAVGPYFGEKDRRYGLLKEEERIQLRNIFKSLSESIIMLDFILKMFLQHFESKFIQLRKSSTTQILDI